MIMSRILFLTTYGTDIEFSTLITKHSLADNVCYVCLEHGPRFFFCSIAYWT